jgi:hypothetical protein
MIRDTIILGVSFTREQVALGLMTGLALLLVLLLQPRTTLFMGSFVRRLLTFRWINKSASSIRIGPVVIEDESRVRHTHIVGATGSGKTVLLEQLIYQDLARGLGAMIIDPKGDRELYDRIKHFCKKLGRESDLSLLSATYGSESVRWNPCRLGGSAELQTKWFHSGVYQEPFYAKACELGLLQSFNQLLLDKPEGFTLSDLVAVMESLSRKDKNETLQGLAYELYNIAQGEWGEMLCAKEASQHRREVSLLDLTRKNEILYVDLPTEAKAVQSGRIGRLLLQEMMLISGMRKIYPSIRGPKPFSIFVDEFDAFASEGFATFLNKGRSSGFMIHMAHQTLSDLKRISDSFMGQVLGNCAVRFVFRQDIPEDAETWARFMGTRTEVVKTFQTLNGLSTGVSSNREAQSFRIHPDAIKELPTGACIFSDKRSGELTRLEIPFPIRLPAPKNLPAQRPEAENGPIGLQAVPKRSTYFEELATKFQPATPSPTLSPKK